MKSGNGLGGLLVGEMKEDMGEEGGGRRRDGCR